MFDQDIEFGHGGCRARNRVRIRHVKKQRTTANLGCDLRPPVRVARTDENRVAVLRELLGDVQTNSAGGAGDQSSGRAHLPMIASSRHAATKGRRSRTPHWSGLSTDGAAATRRLGAVSPGRSERHGRCRLIC